MPRIRTTIVTGIDIGTSHIKVIVGERITTEAYPQIRASVVVESLGMRRGYIESAPELSKSIERALILASRQAGIDIRRVVVGVHGIGLTGIAGSGHAIITRADSQVTTLDTNKALQNAEDGIGEQKNQKLIHTIPQKWKLDGKEIATKIIGLTGTKLELKTLCITYPEQQIQELLSIFESLGIDVDDVVASPLAASLCLLSKKQRVAGSCLIDIGADVSTCVVYENSVPLIVHSFAIGSNDITHDIALGLKVSLEDAERMKRGTFEGTVSKRKVDEIIKARLTDILELIDSQLKKIHRSGLLPAGALLTGGGSVQKIAEEVAKNVLRIPVTSESPELVHTTKGKLKDTAYGVAFGLALLTNESQGDGARGVRETLIQSLRSVLTFFKQFLP